MSKRGAVPAATRERVGCARTLHGLARADCRQDRLSRDASVWERHLARSVIAALVILPLTRRVAFAAPTHALRVGIAGVPLFTVSMLMLFALSRLHVAEVIAILSITPATVAVVDADPADAP